MQVPEEKTDPETEQTGQQASSGTGHPFKRYDCLSLPLAVQHVAVQSCNCINNRAGFVVGQSHLTGELVEEIGFLRCDLAVGMHQMRCYSQGGLLLNSIELRQAEVITP